MLICRLCRLLCDGDLHVHMVMVITDRFSLHKDAVGAFPRYNFQLCSIKGAWYLCWEPVIVKCEAWVIK